MGSPWKAIADDSRREILMLLKKHPMTPSEISKHFDFTFAAVSVHLRVLRDAGLVTEVREGKNRYYSINQKEALELLKFFENLWNYQLHSLKEFVQNKEKNGRKDEKEHGN